MRSDLSVLGPALIDLYINSPAYRFVVREKRIELDEQLIEQNSVEHGSWAMRCGILHGRDIATLNRKSKRRADHSARPGTAPSGSRLSLGAARKSTGSSGIRLPGTEGFPLLEMCAQGGEPGEGQQADGEGAEHNLHPGIEAQAIRQ